MSTCQYCNILFKPCKHSLGMFCSRSCSVSWTNKKNPKRKRTSRLYFCFACSIPLSKPGQKKYCSSTCKAKNSKQEKIKQWLDGKWNGSRKSGDISSHVRNYLLKQAGYACTTCGWSEINPYISKVILTIDHVDGNAFNNSPDNLRVICYNCHTLTPTFGSLNKGNGVRYTCGMRQREIQKQL